MPLKKHPPAPLASSQTATTDDHDHSPVRPPPIPLVSKLSSSSSSTDSTSASDDSSLSSPLESLRLEEQDSHRHLQAQKDTEAYKHDHPELDIDVSMFERMRVSSPDGPDHRTRPLLHHSHTTYYSRPSGSPGPERPPLPRRNTSFSKRYASLDSPRQVPLPYMPSQVHNASYSASAARVLSQDGQHDPSSSQDGLVQSARAVPPDSTPSGVPGSSSLRTSPVHATADLPVPSHSPPPQYMDTSEDVPAPSRSSSQTHSPERHQHHQYRRNVAGPVQMYGRPMSSPDTPASQIYSPKPVRAASSPSPPESSSRSSTLSLPDPTHTPYHTLPAIQGPSTSTITEGQPLVNSPPSTTTVPSSASYPQASASTSRRPGYMAPPRLPPRTALASSPPDWLREYSEPRRNSSTSVDDHGFPQPAPPTVLTPPPPPQSHAAHEPFLSHAPPPQDSYIAVETSPSEYRLIVRLPGYRRDSITLSTRRRRILHVVADSWEPGGGHFERRISFGYDADLVQVRAEFDGDFLRIVVPRRMAFMTYWGTRS